MSEINRIVDQMDRAFAGDAWHGPSLASLLEGISAEDAAKHPVRGAHSIWELVNHIAAWNSIVRQRAEGTRLGNDGNHLATLARAFTGLPCAISRRRTKASGGQAGRNRSGQGSFVVCNVARRDPT